MLAVNNFFRYQDHAPATAALLAAELGYEAAVAASSAVRVARAMAAHQGDDTNAGYEWQITAYNLSRRAAHFAIMALDGPRCNEPHTASELDCDLPAGHSGRHANTEPNGNELSWAR